MHLAVTLPKNFNDHELAVRAVDESLWLWPLSPCYFGGPAQPGFILGYGSTAAAEIPGAVRRLRTLIDRAKKR
jgi:DNA-binding transcriptional MocR family regulator